ncbi:uncharacterized protein LOC128962114 [Oppia nitens]|uniref:uncharacterized protein LOC128962114 n=1 Tax=Oppia nitens TaxID=1686743 RepID=UPI0023DACA39|nr:uncharacterized protein LOC128962114 [Oppia nitens]
MAGMSVCKERMQKRIEKRQGNLDDILVFDEDIPREARLSFVDFAPTVKHTRDGNNKSVDYYALVDYANKWLERTGSRWDVVNCETVSAIIQLVIERGEAISKQILIVYRSNELTDVPGGAAPPGRVTANYRVTMLRLWIRPAVQQQPYGNQPIIIQFSDYKPEQQVVGNGGGGGGGGGGDDKCLETIDDVVRRLNDDDTINGRILNVQTVGFTATSDGQLDTGYTQSTQWSARTVYVLRVFYLLGGRQDGLVSVIDFMPDLIEKGSMFRRPKYESQSALVGKAYKWLTANSGVQFLNAESVDMKLKSSNKQMSIARDTGDYIRFLRIAYIKGRANGTGAAGAGAVDVQPPSESHNNNNNKQPLYLESRTIVLHKNYAELKRTIADYVSGDQWSAAANGAVVGNQQQQWLINSCETVTVFSSNGNRPALEANGDQSFQTLMVSNMSVNKTEYYAIRLYFDGKDPNKEYPTTSGGDTGAANTDGTVSRKSTCKVC